MIDADFFDIRREKRETSSISIVNGKIRSVSRNAQGGVSIRVLVGTNWGYASVPEERAREGIDRALRCARALPLKEKAMKIEPPALTRSVKQRVKIEPRTVDLQDKLESLQHLDDLQRADKRITNSNTIYSEEITTYNLTNSLGADIRWEETRTGISAIPVARDGEKVRYSYAVKDGTCGFEIVSDPKREDEVAKAVTEACSLLSASRPPRNLLTVITHPSIAGLLAHEVMGHASEADEIIKSRSFLTGKVGKRVGSDKVTMVDDGSLEGEYGSHLFDSEGTPSARTTIIDRGVYKGYMHSLETAGAMGVRPTGNGLAQDFNRRIFVRMTNTFFTGGDWRLDELIEDTKSGILALKAMGGMEDPVGGGFQGKALMGYIIENGELRELVDTFTMTGDALTILGTVDAATREVEFDGSHCGKGEEDIIPVSTGGPYMRAKILIGGG